MTRTDPRPHYGSKIRCRKDGYVDIYEPTHPMARTDGYVFEHRKVAWDAGLLTDPELEVHHKNHVKGDNRLSNLEVKDGAAHALDHAEDRGWVRNQFGVWAVRPRDRRQSGRNLRRQKRSCPNCGIEFHLEKRCDAKYCNAACGRRRNGGRDRFGGPRNGAVDCTGGSI